MMKQAGTFIYRGVLVMYHSEDEEIKMVMQGKVITEGDFYDAFFITTEYIDKTMGYYDKHGTN